ECARPRIPCRLCELVYEVLEVYVAGGSRGGYIVILNHQETAWAHHTHDVPQSRCRALLAALTAPRVLLHVVDRVEHRYEVGRAVGNGQWLAERDRHEVARWRGAVCAVVVDIGADAVGYRDARRERDNVEPVTAADVHVRVDD